MARQSREMTTQIPRSRAAITLKVHGHCLTAETRTVPRTRSRSRSGRSSGSCLLLGNRADSAGDCTAAVAASPAVAFQPCDKCSAPYPPGWESQPVPRADGPMLDHAVKCRELRLCASIFPPRDVCITVAYCTVKPNQSWQPHCPRVVPPPSQILFHYDFRGRGHEE